MIVKLVDLYLLCRIVGGCGGFGFIKVFKFENFCLYIIGKLLWFGFFFIVVILLFLFIFFIEVKGKKRKGKVGDWGWV